jgi:hypothetical protein
MEPGLPAMTDEGRGLGGKGRGLAAWGCWRLTERPGAAGGGADGACGPRGGPAWREGVRADTGADRQRDIQTPGTDSRRSTQGQRAAAGSHLAAAVAAAPAAGPLSPRCGPPSLPAGGQAAGAGPAEAAATPEPPTAER